MRVIKRYEQYEMPLYRMIYAYLYDTDNSYQSIEDEGFIETISEILGWTREQYLEFINS